MSQSNQVNQLTDTINFSDTSTAHLSNSLLVTVCQGHPTSSHAHVFHILVSVRGFKGVELRVLVTVFKCSLVFPPPQAKPELSSCCLSWSCSPARDSNPVLIQLYLKVTVHSSDLNYTTWNTTVSAHCSSVTSSLPCPKGTAVLQSCVS